MKDENDSPFASQDDQRESDAGDPKIFDEDTIKNLLNSENRVLKCPEPMEKAYWDHTLKHAIKAYRFNGTLALFLFLIITIDMFTLMPASSVAGLMKLYLFAISVLLTVRIMTLFRVFDRWFYWYLCLSCTVMVTLNIYTNNVFPMGEGTIMSYTGLSYLMFFVYCFIGLRLRFAIAANVIGGILGFLLTFMAGGQVNIYVMPPIFGLASTLALLIALGLDHQNRISFLKSKLLFLAMKKSEKLSREDALTGLANRRYLNEMLAVEWNRMLRQKQPLTIIMIDIDFFKRYNDSLGHLAGDQCLHQIAQLISEEAKRSGELAARYGGEEFVLLFPDMDANLAKQHAERLLARVNKAAIPHPDCDIGIVSVSVGISVCIPEPHMTVDTQLRHADDALYRAKANGKNRYELF